MKVILGSFIMLMMCQLGTSQDTLLSYSRGHFYVGSDSYSIHDINSVVDFSEKEQLAYQRLLEKNADMRRSSRSFLISLGLHVSIVALYNSPLGSTSRLLNDSNVVPILPFVMVPFILYNGISYFQHSAAKTRSIGRLLRFYNRNIDRRDKEARLGIGVTNNGVGLVLQF